MLVYHVKHAIGGEVVGDDDHLVCLAVIIAEHGFPFVRLLVAIGSKTLSGNGDADFHHTLEVVHAFEVEVIGGHIVHTIFETFWRRGIVNTVHSQGLCALDGAGTKLDAVVDHVDGIRLLVHLEGALFLGRGFGFRTHDGCTFNHVDRVAES